MNQRPTAEEFNSYYGRYIDQAKGDAILPALQTGLQDILEFIATLPATKWDYRYGEDKWTIKEVLLHLIDSERIFAYRALRVARHDSTALAGFDQNEYIPYNRAEQRTPISIQAEYQTVRAATLSLYKNLPEEDLLPIGTASGMPISSRALGFIIAGHEQHHLRILKERYL